MLAEKFRIIKSGLPPKHWTAIHDVQKFIQQFLYKKTVYTGTPVSAVNGRGHARLPGAFFIMQYGMKITKTD